MLAVVLSLFALMQFLRHVAACKCHGGNRAFPVAGDFHAPGKGIGHANTHAVQAAGKAVGASFALVEFASCMQLREYQFKYGRLFFGMQSEWNAAPIVFHTDRSIGVQGHADFFSETGQCFVCGIVDHLLKDVQGGVGSGIHARPLLDGLQSFENADGALGISRGGGLDRHKNRCRQIGRQSFSICVFLQYKRTIG